MELKKFVDSEILEYPSLYRSDTYEKSRLHVLHQIFLVIGNGLEWHKKGFMHYPGKKFVEIKLPEKFFEWNLWSIDIKKENIPSAIKFIGDHYCYIAHACLYGDKQIIFEGSKEFAQEVINRFQYIEKETGFDKDYLLSPREVCSFDRQHKDLPDEILTPYPMCRYSALVEMINKKTDSPHIKNFELTFILPDWIQGALDIAQNTLDFYSDPKKIIYCSYHPKQCLKDFKKEYHKDTKKYIEERSSEGMTSDIKIEDWCTMCWERFLKEQIGYCEKFIQMYGK